MEKLIEMAFSYWEPSEKGQLDVGWRQKGRCPPLAAMQQLHGPRKRVGQIPMYSSHLPVTEFIE